MLYPEIQTSNYKFSITDNGNGTITINAGQSFMVGNVILNTDDFSSANRTKAHSANKTYHLRYSLNGTVINSYDPTANSFYLIDSSNPDYNPSGLPQDHLSFDSTYDDMKIAVVVTDGSNDPTIVGIQNTRWSGLVDNNTLQVIDNKLKLVDRIENNIMLNAFRIAGIGSLSQHGMVDGTMDEFEDETGLEVDSYTKLLMHNEGTHESTNFVDSSKLFHPFTVNGTVNISTAQKKFGNSSAYFDGSSGYLVVPKNDAWNFTGDFTLELFYYTGPAGPNSRNTFLSWGDNDTSPSIDLWINSDVLYIHTNTSSVGASLTWEADTWYHIAAVKNGNNVYLFRDGSLVNSGTHSGSIDCSNLDLHIGHHSKTGFPDYCNGYIDEIRVSNGIARWTSGFTSPTQPYLNSVSNIYNSTDDYFESTDLVDSYSETNYDANELMYSGHSEQAGQALTLSYGSLISKIKVYLSKVGSPTGNMVAKLFASTGTIGSTGTPTGSILATSDTVDVSTFGTSMTLVDFNFSTPYRMPAGGACVLLEYTGGDASNYVKLGKDATSPIHSGNYFYTDTAGGPYTASSANDLCFYLYKEDIDMILVSIKTEVEEAPNDARIIMMLQEVDSIVVNTDLKAYVSRDDGLNWNEVTLVSEGYYLDTRKVISGQVILTSDGNNLRWKIETLNDKKLKIHGVGLSWG